MKLYRVSARDDDHEHLGYRFFSNAREAEREMRNDRRNGFASEMEAINVTPNRKGLVRALNIFAGHADNG